MYPKTDMLCSSEGETACESSQDSLFVPYHDLRRPRGPRNKQRPVDIEYESNQHSFLLEAEVLAILDDLGIISWIKNK